MTSADNRIFATPEQEEAHARARAAREEWKTLSEEEKDARIRAGWEEYRRRRAEGAINLPEQLS